MAKPLYYRIQEAYQLGPASHFTHIENLESIVQRGLSSKRQLEAIKYTDLSDKGIQEVRAEKTVLDTGRTLHDYVPIYFGVKTPMIMKHDSLNEQLIYLRFSLDILSMPGVVFTDGNARSDETKFFKFDGIDSLKVLDCQAINAFKWADDADKKRRKQAEILVPNQIAFSQVLNIACFSGNSKDRVLQILKECGTTKAVFVKRFWYFVKD